MEVVANAALRQSLVGRKPILTNHEIIDDTTIVDVLNHGIKLHRDNRNDINYLINYFKGTQDILWRQKDVREDVNNTVVINYAQSTTRDIVGYTFGKPIQYTQRKTAARKQIQQLNDYMEAEDKAASDQEIATHCSICGVGYRGVFPDATDDDSDDVTFKLITLDPANTFVIYSCQMGNKPLLGVHCYEQTIGDETFEIYECYSHNKYWRFKTFKGMGLVTEDAQELKQPHVLKQVPIIEYQNNQWRMGHWETAIGLLNAINLVGSDSVNDVEQFVNSILVVTNAEFDEDSVAAIKRDKMVSLIAPQPGMQVDMKYIAAQLDTNGVEILRQYLEEAYRAVVGVPDRKTRGGGGGDTGDAVKLRDGWANMEIVARNTEMFFKRSEKRVLRLVLNILEDAGQLKGVKMTDVDIKFSRNKTDNIQTKIQSGATLHGMNILDPVDVLEIMDISTNPQELVDRGAVYQEQRVQQEMQRQQEMMKQNPMNNTDTNKGEASKTPKEG